MSFSVSKRNNLEGDTVITGDSNFGPVLTFFSLFGDISKAFKGQTIRHDGNLWTKSEKKTFV